MIKPQPMRKAAEIAFTAPQFSRSVGVHLWPQPARGWVISPENQEKAVRDTGFGGSILPAENIKPGRKTMRGHPSQLQMSSASSCSLRTAEPLSSGRQAVEPQGAPWLQSLGSRAPQLWSSGCGAPRTPTAPVVGLQSPTALVFRLRRPVEPHGSSLRAVEPHRTLQLWSSEPCGSP